MFNSTISHRADKPKDGWIYVPECIRPMLPSTLCAVVEKRHRLGTCIAFYLKMHNGMKGQDVAFSDGYLCIGRLCAEAGIKEPRAWCAITNAKGSLDALLLHYDKPAADYEKANSQRK